ncbi:MAG: tetratricopeptide repeat protein [Candidatus Eisenbacteria bacterium]
MSPFARLTIVVLSLFLLVLVACMANPHFVGGKNYVNQEVWDKAAAELEIATSQQPENAEAWFYLGKSYGELGEFGKAADAFQKATDLSDQFDDETERTVDVFWQDLAARGQDLEKGGAYADAAVLIEDAIRLRPRHIPSYRFIARLYAQVGEVDKAASMYEEALDIRADDDTTLTNYAKLLFDNGLEERAIPVFERLSKIQPDDETLNYQLADLYWGSGRRDDALAIYRKYGDASSLMANATKAYDAGNFPEALSYYDMVRQVAEPGSDNYADAFYNSVVTALQMKDTGQAIRIGEELVKERPGDSRNWRALGQAYREAGMQEKALDAYKKSQDLERGGGR